MPPPYCYDYPRPAVTVDLVAFSREGGRLRVLLIRRKGDPFAGRWALPGGFLDIDEPVEAAARRELKEETGLDVGGPVSFLAAFGDPGRDPRGRTISLVHVTAVPGPPPSARGGDDAQEAAWLDPTAARGLAFDHDAILARALAWLGVEIACGGPAALALLPETFDEADVQSLLQASGLGDNGSAWLEARYHGGRIEPYCDQPGRYRATRPPTG